MIDFVFEGSLGNYAILVVGLLLLINEILKLLLLSLTKGEATGSLRIETSSVWLGCIALVAIGAGWTGLSVYVVEGAVAWSDTLAGGTVTAAEVLLTPLGLSLLLSAIIALTHYATRYKVLKARPRSP